MTTVSYKECCDYRPTEKNIKVANNIVMLPPLAKLLRPNCVAELLDVVLPKPILEGLKNWILGLLGDP